MGYYSDVGLALTRDGVAFLNQRLEEADAKIRTSVKELLAFANTHLQDKETGAECWQWNTVKWYQYDPEYFPDIDFLERQLTDMNEADYYFLRIGEKFDDIEQKGDYWENVFEMHLTRSIFFDCDTSQFQNVAQSVKNECPELSA